MSEKIPKVKRQNLEEAEPVKSFYETDYWQKGAGQLLWNLRKVTAFINAISDSDTPHPFLTVIPYDSYGPETAENWVGWWAAWNDGGEESLYVEAEGESFTVSALGRVDKDGKRDVQHLFYHQMGNDEEGNHGWGLFDEALADAKQWLINNKHILVKDEPKPRSLYELFNIKDKL